MSICGEHETLSDTDYAQRLSDKFKVDRVPAYGTIALTDRCNLRCLHCYARSSSSDAELQAREMDTAAHLDLIDEMAREGALFLLLTGGEPLLRPDFSQIYTRAKQDGLVVTVFTNGTLVTDKILALFADLPPRKVEISIYGATAETHDAITGSPGSFERTWRGIERLKTGGVFVALKTILMTRNRTEFKNMKKMADDCGATFRYDPCIFPRLDGVGEPLALRLTPDEIVQMDFSDPEKILSWQRYAAAHRDIPPAKRLYCCGAGVTSFWIDPYGDMQPCVMVRHVKISVLKEGFAAAWKRVVARMDKMEAAAQFSCNTCDKKALCGYCPGFFELESGSETTPSDFLCTIGKLRLVSLKDIAHKERGKNGKIQQERTAEA